MRVTLSIGTAIKSATFSQSCVCACHIIDKHNCTILEDIH